MLIKCPHDGATMSVDEEKHTCPECDTQMSLSEAEALFEAGEVVAIVEDGDSLEEGVHMSDKKKDEMDDEESDDDSEDDEDDDEEDEEDKNEAVSTLLSDYAVVSKILRAGKKGQMSEAYMTDLVEALVEGTEINFHKIDMALVTEWAEGLLAESAIISEDLVKALAGEESLTEESKSDVTVVFEAALNVRAKQIKEHQAEVYAAKLVEAEATIRSSIEEEVDGYLDVVVAEWMAENKLAIESGMKVEMTESFLDGLQELFVEHYVEIPEGKEDVLESLANQVSELEEAIADIKTSEEASQAKIVEMKKEASFKIVAEGLAETSKEKLAELAESVEFVEEEAYKAKLLKLKESFLSEDKAVVSATPVIEEGVLDESESKTKTGSQFAYINDAVAALKSNQ
jgi:hypothetical protein